MQGVKLTSVILFVCCLMLSHATEQNEVLKHKPILETLLKMFKSVRVNGIGTPRQEEETEELSEILVLIAGAASLVLGVPIILGLLILPVFFMAPFASRFLTGGLMNFNPLAGISPGLQGGHNSHDANLFNSLGLDHGAMNGNSFSTIPISPSHNRGAVKKLDESFQRKLLKNIDTISNSIEKN